MNDHSMWVVVVVVSVSKAIDDILHALSLFFSFFFATVNDVQVQFLSLFSCFYIFLFLYNILTASGNAVAVFLIFLLSALWITLKNKKGNVTIGTMTYFFAFFATNVVKVDLIAEGKRVFPAFGSM